MYIAIIASLIAGLLNAVSGLFQRKGTGMPAAEKLYSKLLIVETSKNRLWRIGVIAEGIAALLELVALYFGSLLLVEPLLMTNLVFLLAIVHFRMKKPVLLREWVGIIFICIGISVFVAVAKPHGGRGTFGLIWLVPIITISLLMALGALIARRITNNPKRRGLVGAVVAGLSLGMTAALTRLTMIQLHTGIVSTLSRWPLYALIISAVVSIITVQVGYGSGPLTITQSMLEISSLIVSTLLGLQIFGDTISTSLTAIIIETISFAIVVGGVIIISTSKPIVSLEASVIKSFMSKTSFASLKHKAQSKS